MISALKLYFRSDLRNKHLILVLLFIANLAEGVGLAAVLPALTIGAASTGGSGSQFAADAIDMLAAYGLPTDFVSLLLIAVGAFVLREVILFAAMAFFGYRIADLTNAYRWRLIDAFMKARWDYFAHSSLGKYAYSITTFAQNATDVIQTSARMITTGARVFVYIAVMLIVSGKFALIALLAGGGVYALLSVFVGVAHRAGTKQGRALEKLSGSFVDVFNNLKAIKAMERQWHIHQVFEGTVTRLARLLRRIIISREALISSQSILETILLALLLYLSFSIWNVPLVELGFIGALMLQVMKSISKIQKTLQRIAASEVNFWRMQEILKDAEVAAEVVTGTKPPDFGREIRLEDVGFSYAEKTVFECVNAVIPAGKLTVLFGPSGQGKTTLLDMVIGLYKPSGGRILVDGTPLEDIDLRQWRGKIGYVPQELILHSGSIRSNLSLGDPDITDEMIDRALHVANAHAFVYSLPEGLDTEVGEHGLRVSGGERQRLSLARALVHEPQLLILDEVTSALDPETERRICQEIRNITGKVTVTAITHRPAWLEVADEVLEVNDGQVTRANGDGSPLRQHLPKAVAE